MKASSSTGRTALSKYCMKEDTRVLGPWADTVVYLGSDLPSKLLPYQQSLRDYILGPVNNREILWIYDKHGNSGKSIWAKYMFYKHNILKLTWGDTSNMINLICKHGPQRAYIFDMSRTKPKAFSVQDLYNTLEDVKNGYVVNLKYETSTMAMDPPHVVVLANQRPDKGAVSLDRWNVVKLPSGINPYAANSASQFDPATIYDVAGEPSDSEDDDANVMGDHPHKQKKTAKRKRADPPGKPLPPQLLPDPPAYITNRKLLPPLSKKGPTRGMPMSLDNESFTHSDSDTDFL